jgi:GTP diphosphokinase / guanosine-3',5'-bis(diphosphate) 3'-diphosphatase
MTSTINSLHTIVRALKFAANKHRNQKRKDQETPYINHPIDVLNVLVNEGDVQDEELLIGAILHDTVEDTDATFDEIEAEFGSNIRSLVGECTDDKSLSQEDRKAKQVESAPHKSVKAKQIKLADKISNLRDMIQSPPADWSRDRKSKYIEWSRQVVAGLRGANEALERVYDQTYEDCCSRLRD